MMPEELSEMPTEYAAALLKVFDEELARLQEKVDVRHDALLGFTDKLPFDHRRPPYGEAGRPNINNPGRRSVWLRDSK